MRQRRIARCLSRADAALIEGRLDEARAALDEVRELDQSAPELEAFEQRLAALHTPAPTVATPAVEAAADTEPPSVAPRRLRRLAALAAGILITLSAAAYGARQWYFGPRVEPMAVVAETMVTLPQPAAAAATSGARDATHAIDRLQIVHETITAPVVTPRIVTDETRLPAYPAPPIADAEPQAQPETVLHALNRPESPTPTIPEVQPRNELPVEPVAPPPTPVDPPLRAVALPPEPAPSPAKPAAATPAVEEAPVARDESVAVRSVLSRYEVAYSSLDAAAAIALLPTVDRGALKRAFEGLSSQRISLGACDVTVSGPAAQAICSGSATWEPKVGGGVRTRMQTWNFDLRKNGEAWRIEKAIAR